LSRQAHFHEKTTQIYLEHKTGFIWSLDYYYSRVWRNTRVGNLQCVGVFTTIATAGEDDNEISDEEMVSLTLGKLMTNADHK